jgi:site-specific recombinase XerD
MKTYSQLVDKNRAARIERIFLEVQLESDRRILKQFDNFNFEKNKSIQTRVTYLQSVKTLAIWYSKGLDNIKDDGLKRFFREEFLEKSKITTYVAKTNLIQFFRWMYSSKTDQNRNTLKLKDDIDVISWIQLNRKDKEKLPEELLTVEDINNMASVCDNFRDKAIVKMLYETGARKGEFLQLKIRHLQEDEVGIVCILPMGKTNSRRLRLLSSVPDIKLWLNSHPYKDDVDAPLFVTLGSRLGRALYEDGLKVLLKKYAERAEIKKRVFPHLFRHSRATHLAKQGFSEAELRVIFGWSITSNMPTKYVHLAGNDIEEKLLRLNGQEDAVKKTKEEAMKLREWACPRCKEDNPSQDKYCNKCGWDNTMDYAEYLKMQYEHSEMKDKLDKLSQVINKWESKWKLAEV